MTRCTCSVNSMMTSKYIIIYSTRESENGMTLFEVFISYVQNTARLQILRSLFMPDNIGFKELLQMTIYVCSNWLEIADTTRYLACFI